LSERRDQIAVDLARLADDLLGCLRSKETRCLGLATLIVRYSIFDAIGRTRARKVDDFLVEQNPTMALRLVRPLLRSCQWCACG